MSTTPMNAVDAAWYHMDGPANLAMVTGVTLTGTPLDYSRVKQLYKLRLRAFARFRQRVVESAMPFGTPHWEDVPQFDIDQHVHHVALPAPRDRQALAELVSDLASTPLDRKLPLWQVHVVDEVGPGSALVMRFHHCIGDGTAMMAIVQELFDGVPDAPLGGEPPPEIPAPERGLLDRLFANAVGVVDWSARTASSTVEAALDVVRHPDHVVETAAAVVSGAGMLISELLKPADPLTPLKGDYGLQKRVAWSEPVALSDIRAIASGAGAKVNDVLVAGASGALRTYLAGRGVDVDRLTLRAMVPVDLRPRDRALDLGNEFGLVILKLPVGTPDPIERLRITKAHMDALKRSPEAIAIWTLFNIFGRGPKIIEDLAVDIFGSKASLVLTNVVGPRERLYLAGTPVDQVMFWVPHPGKQLGMGISILSYNGRVSLAVVADAHLVPDPGAITEEFNREFERMLAAAQERRAGSAPPQ